MSAFIYPKHNSSDKVAAFEVVKWKNLSPMKSARANFASLVIDNKIYVYGGISESKDHKPVLANPICEVYDPSNNSWTEVAIPNAP